MRSVKIKEIMSTAVVSVGLTDPLSTVQQIFSYAHFHHLLVIEDGDLLGVISDRDLFKALSPNIGKPTETLEDAATLDIQAAEIMTSDLVLLDVDSTVGDAIEMFNENVISCIPIVDRDDKPAGIVSWRDILEAIPSSSESFI